MFIRNLKLYNYRNYSELNIDFSDKYNIVYGENAQGKTNILESIFVCAAGRSHRTSKDQDLVKQNEAGFHIKLEVEKKGYGSLIDIAYEKEGRKRIRINEKPVKKIADMMGQLNAVLFSPEDLLIIKEGPVERRRFIDIAISQLKPSYFYDLQQYMRVMAHRNSLLKEAGSSRTLLNTLDIWNEKLSDIGSRIVKVRNDFVNVLNRKIADKHLKLTDSKERLNIRYSPSFNIDGYVKTDDIKRDFERAIEKMAKRELEKCVTLVGPQRDDYDIFLNDMNIKLYGSQGQQRTAILAVKLSEMDIMKEYTEENPVLLLDDVLSELDSRRREYLFDNISDMQTIITCTDSEFFNERKNINYNYYKVIDGSVVREGQ